MCELFGLSSSHPMPLRNTPLVTFRLRGGQTADNPDGWGIAWHSAKREASGFELVKEPQPGCDSALFEQMAEMLVSDLVIGHVRKARLPPVNTLDNTHPFLRECCGQVWAFAHNGLVPDVVGVERSDAKPFCRPEGETDSEYAFCHFLGRLHRLPSGSRFDEIARMSEAIARTGKFNFLLSDGLHLIAYGHDRLHYLESHGGGENVVLIATEPLSQHGGWTAFAPGELRIYRGGECIGSMPTHVADTQS